MDVTLPDGTTVQGVPDGTSKAQLAQKLKANGRTVPDDWLAPAKPAPQAGLKDALRTEMAAPAGAEAAMAMGSGMLAKPISDVAGLAATGKEMISPTPGGGDPAAFKRHIQEMLTYTPRRAEGRAIAEYNPMALAGKGVDWLGGAAERLVAPPETSGPLRAALGYGVHEAVNQAPGLLGTKVGGKLAEKLPETQAGLDALKNERKVVDSTRDASQDSGYITPPEWGVKAGAAGLAGKAKVEKMISEKNAENASRKMGGEVGIPEGAPLSVEEIATQKREAGKAYDALAAGAGPKLAVTQNFQAALKSTLAKMDDEIAFNKEAAKPLMPARKLLKSFADQTEFPTPATIRAIQRQRKLAKDDFRKGDSDMGTARMAISNQLENLIEENLTQGGKAGLVDEFKAARTKFAQLYFLDRVVNEATGKVDLAKVAALSERPAYKGVLTGAFKEAADFAKGYRKAAQKTTGEAPPRLTVFDGMFALGALASGHPGALAAAAGEIGGRLAVPALAQRGLMQNRTPSYQASQLPPALARAAGVGTSSEAGRLQPPPE